MQYIRPAVSTMCLGRAASMGATLLASGHKGKRLALPSSRIMIHQPHIQGSGSGQATDIAIRAREVTLLKDRLAQILAEATGRPLETIHQDTERDHFMSAQQALEYGLVDQVVDARELAQNVTM